MSTTKSLHVSEIKGRVHVAIITIRPDEYDAVDSFFSNLVIVKGGNNSYEYTTIEPERISVVLTRCVGQGNTISQSVANNIIYDIDPSWLFLVGIAGGIPDNEFSLGDVILASALHDFSFGAANEGGRTTYQSIGGQMHPDVNRFLSTKIVGKRRKQLTKLAGFATQRFRKHPKVFPTHLNASNGFYGDADYQDDVRRKLAQRFPKLHRKGGPVVWTGPCANGNLLLKDSELLKKWQTFARQVVHVETELVGVYEAARSAGRQNYPVLAIRGLSDIVGIKRNPEWTEYACQTAAAVTYAILRSGFIDFSGNLPPLVSAPLSYEDPFIKTLNQRASFYTTAMNNVIKELSESSSKDARKIAKEMNGFKKQFHSLQKKHITAMKQNDTALAHELVRQIHTIQENVVQLLTSNALVREVSPPGVGGHSWDILRGWKYK